MIKLTTLTYNESTKSTSRVPENLFPQLFSLMSTAKPTRSQFVTLLDAVRQRLIHPSLRLDMPSGYSKKKFPSFIEKATDELLSIEKEIAEAITNQRISETVAINLNDYLSKRLGSPTIEFERDFDYVQQKLLEDQLGGLNKEMTGEVAQDNANSLIRRLNRNNGIVTLLVAWSSADLDIAINLKRIDKALSSAKKRGIYQSRAFRHLTWLETLYNQADYRNFGTPLEGLKNPWSDAVLTVKRAIHYENEKVNRYKKSWVENRFQKAYLGSGSNIQRLYFTWALSILRDLMVLAGVKKKTATERIEGLYLLLGVDLSWEQVIRNSGGVKRASLPDPAIFYFQLRSLSTFLGSLDLI